MSSVNGVNIDNRSSFAHVIIEDPDQWHNHLFGFEMPVDVISILYAGTVALGGGIGYFTKGKIELTNILVQNFNLFYKYITLSFVSCDRLHSISDCRRVVWRNFGRRRLDDVGESAQLCTDHG